MAGVYAVPAADSGVVISNAPGSKPSASFNNEMGDSAEMEARPPARPPPPPPSPPAPVTDAGMSSSRMLEEMPAEVARPAPPSIARSALARGLVPVTPSPVTSGASTSCSAVMADRLVVLGRRDSALCTTRSSRCCFSRADSTAAAPDRAPGAPGPPPAAATGAGVAPAAAGAAAGAEPAADAPPVGGGGGAGAADAAGGAAVALLPPRPPPLPLLLLPTVSSPYSAGSILRRSAMTADRMLTTATRTPSWSASAAAVTVMVPRADSKGSCMPTGKVRSSRLIRSSAPAADTAYGSAAHSASGGKAPLVRPATASASCSCMYCAALCCCVSMPMAATSAVTSRRTTSGRCAVTTSSTTPPPPPPNPPPALTPPPPPGDMAPLRSPTGTGAPSDRHTRMRMTRSHARVRSDTRAGSACSGGWSGGSGTSSAARRASVIKPEAASAPDDASARSCSCCALMARLCAQATSASAADCTENRDCAWKWVGDATAMSASRRDHPTSARGSVGVVDATRARRADRVASRGGTSTPNATAVGCGSAAGGGASATPHVHSRQSHSRKRTPRPNSGFHGEPHTRAAFSTAATPPHTAAVMGCPRPYEAAGSPAGGVPASALAGAARCTAATADRSRSTCPSDSNPRSWNISSRCVTSARSRPASRCRYDASGFTHPASASRMAGLNSGSVAEGPSNVCVPSPLLAARCACRYATASPALLVSITDASRSRRCVTLPSLLPAEVAASALPAPPLAPPPLPAPTTAFPAATAAAAAAAAGAKLAAVAAYAATPASDSTTGACVATRSSSSTRATPPAPRHADSKFIRMPVGISSPPPPPPPPPPPLNSASVDSSTATTVRTPGPSTATLPPYAARARSPRTASADASAVLGMPLAPDGVEPAADGGGSAGNGGRAAAVRMCTSLPTMAGSAFFVVAAASPTLAPLLHATGHR